MGVAIVPFRTRKAVFNGLVLPEQLAKLSRRDKKRLDAQRVRHDQVDSWAVRTKAALEELNLAVQARIDDTLGMLHDVQTAVSSLLRGAEAFVAEQPGSSFEDKVERLPQSAMSVVKAVQLLQARLNLLPLLTNPAAARYGQKRPTPVYRVVDRLVRTLRPMAEREHVRLALSGESYNLALVYDSFETIPLILLDNAIKYSRRDQQIDIVVDDAPRGVRVEVRSFSPQLTPEERSRVFERGYRGSSAARVASRGSGLGLYLAGTVARAHGIAIYHASGDR